MKVRDWMEKFGLTLDSEMPAFMGTDELIVPGELIEDLSEENKGQVYLLAASGGSIDNIKQCVEWIKAGDIVMYNTDATKNEALNKIQSDFNVLYLFDNIEPVRPLEYFYFRENLVSYTIAMRFRAVDKNK